MGLREVEHMDVVTNGRAIGSRIVGTVYSYWAASFSGLEHKRDQVGFGIMCLAVALGGAGGIEVAQRRADQLVCWGDPFEHALGHQLRLAIGIGWMTRR